MSRTYPQVVTILRNQEERTEAHLLVGKIQRVMEGVLLAMLILSPWALGSVEPVCELFLHGGVGFLLLLWCAQLLLSKQLKWTSCPVWLTLGGLVLLSFLHLLPLPRPAVQALSPKAAQLYAATLPASAEKLSENEEDRIVVNPAPGTALSLNPGATRLELFRLLSVLVLFAVVRNCLASPNFLKQLSYTALVNGSMLAGFAVLQALMAQAQSGPLLIFGRFSTEGALPFGTFVCRNHFPFYMNLCIGLTAGLLLKPEAFALKRTGNGKSSKSHEEESDSFLETFTGLLQEPRTLWLGLPLALMVVSVVMSLSRGGLLALLAGAVVFLLVLPRRMLSLRSLVFVGFVGMLIAWVGLDQVIARWETLYENQSRFLDSRWPLWQRCARIVRDFPLLGSGLGTFNTVEFLYRSDGTDSGIEYENAHNDLLEALIEGGIVRFALSLLAIFFVLRFAWKARQTASTPLLGMLAGSTFAFTTLVAHSIGDFGLHVPAIAVFATTLAALLAHFGSAKESEQEFGREARPDSKQEPTQPNHFELVGPFPVLAVFGLLGLAFLITRSAWHTAWADVYSRYYARSIQAEGQPERRLQQVEYLDLAVSHAQDNAVLHVEAGVAHQRYAQELPEQGAPAVAEEKAVHHFIAASYFLKARDLCPILHEPHLQLALYTDLMKNADPAERYLERAQLLRPGDPEVWYWTGEQHMQANREDKAWTAWQTSLKLSNKHLPKMLTNSTVQLLSETDLLAKLPDDPDMLLLAANHRYPKPEEHEQREPLLRKALALMKQGNRTTQSDDLYQLGRIHRLLGERSAAIKALQEALKGSANKRWEWRLELAVLLEEDGQLDEAKQHLTHVMMRAPNNKEAKALQERLQKRPAFIPPKPPS